MLSYRQQLLLVQINSDPGKKLNRFKDLDISTKEGRNKIYSDFYLRLAFKKNKNYN